jgi:hypothetical protein
MTKMADNLEARVAVLERDVAALKARTDTHDADLQTIPGLIQTQFRFQDTKLARLQADLTQHMDDRFDAVLRAVSEIVAGRRD